MRILSDTNLFIKFYHRQPLPSEVERAFADTDNELCLASVSVIEIYRLWQAGRLKDSPDDWLDLALTSWTTLPMTAPIARQSAIWNWEHRDPADRIIAATAHVEKVVLWHTDTILKKQTGFPQKFHRNRLEEPSA